MDLIYTDKYMDDVGVILNGNLDLAYGSDENDFELQVRNGEYDIDVGSVIYIENTEYGGIIDGIEVSSNSQIEVFSGRSFHGILASKVIEPEGDYLMLYGDANNCIAQIISLLNLSDIFVAESEPSGIEICGYRMNRYIDGYSGLCQMLNSVFCKLKMCWQNGLCHLSAAEYIDYSQDEEFDTSVVEMTVKKQFHPVNHLVCLGRGDLSNRAVIHLFTDENGGIQPFSTVEEPYCNEQYILTKEKQKLFGLDEVSQSYDYSSAELTENYIALQEQPNDWAENCNDYFFASDDGYKNVEFEKRTDYSALNSKPADWENAYTKYFFRQGEDYKSVEGEEAESFSLVTAQPASWAQNYHSYYEYYSDGVSSEYKEIGGLTNYYYSVQTQVPTDWDENYSQYYLKNGAGKFIPVESVTPQFKFNAYYEQSAVAKYISLKKKPSDWNSRFTNYYAKKGGKYIKLSGTKAPSFKVGAFYEKTTEKKYTVLNEKPNKWAENFDKYYQKINGSFLKVTKSGAVWKPGTYYTRFSNSVAPSFSAQKVYSKNSATGAPTFVSGNYYSAEQKNSPPSFVRGKFYKLYIDKYATLVQGGIEKLKELWATDEVDVKFDAKQEYDIGDVIGATKLLSNIFIRKQITKKIVKINSNGTVEVSYEVGEL
ncbi:hypothetical protein [Eubacterium sp.]